MKGKILSCEPVEGRLSWFPECAVDNISFSVQKGEVLGFLGPNGAGKSTSMRMITGYLPRQPEEFRSAGMMSSSRNLYFIGPTVFAPPFSRKRSASFKRDLLAQRPSTRAQLIFFFCNISSIASKVARNSQEMATWRPLSNTSKANFKSPN